VCSPNSVSTAVAADDETELKVLTCAPGINASLRSRPEVSPVMHGGCSQLPCDKTTPQSDSNGGERACKHGVIWDKARHCNVQLECTGSPYVRS
jgi:hypothetical protein